MGSEAGRSGYFEGSNFIRTEPQLFKLGEIVTLNGYPTGLFQITKVEITKYRREPGSTIREDRDGYYYHIQALDGNERYQEFNGTLKKAKLGNLLYG